MTTLLALRDAVAAGLAADARLTARKIAVSVHGGDFKLDDIKRYGKNAPAVVVSLLDVKTEDVAGSTWATCTFGVACLAKPRPPLSHHDCAVDIVDATLRALRGEFWGLLDLKAPEKITARNLFSDGLKDLGGVALWACGFQQMVELSEDDDPSVPWSTWAAEFDPQETDPDRPHMYDEGEIEQ